MLPQILLDDEEFLAIRETAVKEISVRYPEWTDYNLHDPGITIIELFAWFTELQRFHLDRTGAAQLPKHLKLLGVRPKERVPAEAELLIHSLPAPVLFPKGSRFYAKDICFETTEQAYVGTARAVKLGHAKRSRTGRRAVFDTVTYGKGLRFSAFGDFPEAGNILAVGFDGPLLPGVSQRLCMHFCSDAKAKRNPVSDVFVPLAEYTLSYCTKSGYCRADIIRDSTNQMLWDGFLSFSVAEEMKVEQDGLYWLYIELTECDYDLPPVIEEISLSCIRARQVYTLAECHEVILEQEYLTVSTYLAYSGEYMCFLLGEDGYTRCEGTVRRECGKDGVRFYLPKSILTAKQKSCLLLLYEPGYRERLFCGEGGGMPFQEYLTDIWGLCKEGLKILAETEKGSGCFRFWELCTDFDASGPMDRHCCFEEETGALSFGDCDHGMAPEGKILLAAAHTSLGAAGNVKAESISRMGDIPWEKTGPAAVINEKAAAGGADQETFLMCRERMQRGQKETTRAVTCEDFEILAKRTPGLAIENARAVLTAGRNGIGMEEETVIIIVKPFSKKKQPSFGSPYRKNIMGFLERYRMIGTGIRVLPPEYTEVTIFVEAGAKGGAEEGKRRIEKLLYSYFERIHAEFGICISYSAVYGMIDVLDCVSAIKSLSIDARGKNIRRSRNGDVHLPVNGLACLKEVSCVVSSEREGKEGL